MMFRRSPPPSVSPTSRDFSAAPSCDLRFNEGWWAGAIFLITVLAYLPAMHGGFIWDDDAHVTRAGLRSLQGLWLIWSNPHATQQYYPLLHSAFWFEHRLWGDQTIGYHLTNILLHAGNACLLALVLRQLAIPGAWLAAFIFALHPVCVESVAWISEQKNTLSTAFYLLSTLVYLRFDEKRTPGAYALALFLFLLALLTKSVTATLPAALLVIFWWRRGRLSWRRDVLPLLPWFVVGAAAGLFTSWVEQKLGAHGADFAFSPAQRFLVAGRVIWFYAGKLLWPGNLVFIYPRWNVDAAAAWQYLFPLGAIVLTAALWWLHRRTRAPLAGFLFFTGTLFPVLGFLNVYPFIFSFVADHFQYVASLGIIVPLSAGATAAFGRAAPQIRKAGWALAVLIPAILGWRTWQQCGMYRDAETVYRTTLARNPACWMAHDNLGVSLFLRGKTDEAQAHYTQALQLKPDDANIHLNLGALLTKNGKRPEAIAEYKKAIELDPTLVKAYRDLGVTLVQMNRAPEAIGYYEQALKIQPDYADAHEDFGNALLEEGRLAEAIEQFQEVMRLDPDNAEAYLNTGIALARMGRLADAIACYEQALRMDPNYASVHNNLGVALVQSGRVPEAISHYEEALRLDPKNADAHYNLAISLARTGKSAEALEHFQQTVRLQPDYAKAHHNLGILFMQLGRTAEAMTEFEQALRLNPNDAGARAALGQLHAAQPKD